MAKFAIQKWDKKRFPRVFKAQGNKEVYAVYHDKGRFPKIIAKTETLASAVKEINDYSKGRLHSKKPKISYW